MAPSPIPTLEKTSTFLHEEATGCPGPIKFVRKGILSREAVCQTCGEKVGVKDDG